MAVNTQAITIIAKDELEVEKARALEALELMEKRKRAYIEAIELFLRRVTRLKTLVLSRGGNWRDYCERELGLNPSRISQHRRALEALRWLADNDIELPEANEHRVRQIRRAKNELLESGVELNIVMLAIKTAVANEIYKHDYIISIAEVLSDMSQSGLVDVAGEQVNMLEPLSAAIVSDVLERAKRERELAREREGVEFVGKLEARVTGGVINIIAPQGLIDGDEVRVLVYRKSTK